MNKAVRMATSIGGIIVAILFIVTIAIGAVIYTNPFTPAGHEGYVFESPRIFGEGGYQGIIHGPGNFGISLWRNKIQNVDFRPQTYPETFKILAKDELNIAFRFQMVMMIKAGTIKEVVEDYGGVNAYVNYIKEPLRSMVRNQVQTLTSREIKGKREVVAQNVQDALGVYLKDTPFMIISTVVGNIDFPEDVTKAVEKKLVAQQDLETRETHILIAAKDAEIKVAEAKGIAEAQEIINKTLTERYLQHEAIQAQLKMAESPNHTTVYIPSGNNGIPIVRTMN